MDKSGKYILIIVANSETLAEFIKFISLFALARRLLCRGLRRNTACIRLLLTS